MVRFSLIAKFGAISWIPNSTSFPASSPTRSLLSSFGGRVADDPKNEVAANPSQAAEELPPRFFNFWHGPVNKGAKFESDTSLVRRYRSAKLRKVTDFCLQTLCPPKFVPPLPPYKRLKNFMTLRSYIFVNFQQIPFKLGNFTNLKALFPAECRIFPNLSMPKVEIKKTWKGVLYQEL